MVLGNRMCLLKTKIILLRGKGIRRKTIYLNQDANLQQLYAEFENRANDPLNYLRTISYRLAQH